MKRKINAWSIAVLVVCFSCLLVPCTAITDANGENANISVQYTPMYNTQYSLSLPSNVKLNDDGTPTSVPIILYSWMDFPTNQTLVCRLIGITEFSNGKESVKAIVKLDGVTLKPGDVICTFTPDTLDSAENAEPIVIGLLTVEPMSVVGGYVGSLSFSTEIINKTDE